MLETNRPAGFTLWLTGNPHCRQVNPELVLQTDLETLDQSIQRVMDKLHEMGYLPPSERGARKNR